MSDKTFLDTNVCMYLSGEVSSFIKDVALSLLSGTPFISPQVVFECINVCRRKLKYDEDKSFAFAERILSFCRFVDENAHVVEIALLLWRKHQFQPFDAKIVASALEADCDILYSEDMQHGFVVDNSLRIINPFI